MLLRIALRVAPFLEVYWLIILEHFIISFLFTQTLYHNIVLLSSSIFNDYALQTLSIQAPEFPHISVYALCVYRNCQLYLGSYNLRLPSPTLSVWNSLPIFDWTGLEPVTHLLAKRVPNYTISQYNIRLYSSNHNIYGNGYEDYNIFYQGLIS